MKKIVKSAHARAPRRSAETAKLLNSIKKSETKLGSLYPILVDAEGKIIDGNHRRAANPNWPIRKLNVSGVESQIVRIVANMQRREVEPKEKTKWLRDLADATGWTPKRIAEETGFSVSWVRKYLPHEFKDKEHAELAKKKHRSKKEKLASTPGLMVTCPECGANFPLE